MSADRHSLAYASARREQAGEPLPARATPADAFRAARGCFLRGERLDMGALAAGLGISRATLYRWTGGRAQLLSDILWSLAEQLFADAVRDASGKGAARILAVARKYLEDIVGAEALRRFLQNDTEYALRILTTRAGGVQHRSAAAAAGLIREEAQAGHFSPRVDPDRLAYAIVRVSEAFIYNDAIFAIEPDVDSAVEIIALMLD
jgi:AcrR family transcriptional regulator